MRLAVLASGDIHQAKWINSFAQAGHEVHLIAQDPAEEDVRAQVHILPFRRPWGGVLNAWSLRRLLKKIAPDLLHVHGASLDGMLGRLSGFHPSVVSVMGNDVCVFPHASRLTRRILVDNLKYYDWIGSTSEYLAKQILQFLPGEKKLTITPFGVDTRIFAPNPAGRDRTRLHGSSTCLSTIKIKEPL